jgi:hypothetical protein
MKRTLPILTTPVHRTLDDYGGRVLRGILTRTVLTLPIEDGFVCGAPRDEQNWLALLRVLPFAEGAPLANSFFLLRADGVNHHPQALTYGCPVPHPYLLWLVFSTPLYFTVHEVSDKHPILS